MECTYFTVQKEEVIFMKTDFCEIMYVLFM